MLGIYLVAAQYRTVLYLEVLKHSGTNRSMEVKISLLAWLVSTGRRPQAWLGRLDPVGGVPASRIPPPVVGFQQPVSLTW